MVETATLHDPLSKFLSEDENELIEEIKLSQSFGDDLFVSFLSDQKVRSHPRGSVE